MNRTGKRAKKTAPKTPAPADPPRIRFELDGQKNAENVILDAYRRKARETHPDRGGTPEAFAEVNAAKDMAIQLLKSIDPSQIHLETVASSLSGKRSVRATLTITKEVAVDIQMTEEQAGRLAMDRLFSDVYAGMVVETPELMELTGIGRAIADLVANQMKKQKRIAGAL